MIVVSPDVIVCPVSQLTCTSVPLVTGNTVFVFRNCPVGSSLQVPIRIIISLNSVLFLINPPFYELRETASGIKPCLIKKPMPIIFATTKQFDILFFDNFL